MIGDQLSGAFMEYLEPYLSSKWNTKKIKKNQLKKHDELDDSGGFLENGVELRKISATGKDKVNKKELEETLLEDSSSTNDVKINNDHQLKEWDENNLFYEYLELGKTNF